MQLSFLKYSWRDMGISTVTAILASAFLAFGMYHVHSISRITEGGYWAQPCCWSIGSTFPRLFPTLS